MNRWTEKEMQFVTDNYSKKTAKEIGILLNRSKWAVREIARKLQIPKKKEKLTEENYVNVGECRGCKFLGPLPKSSNKKTWWLCSNCKTETVYRTYEAVFYVKSTQCLKCSPSNIDYKKNNKSGEISGKYISSLKWNAKQRDLDYQVSDEYIWGLFLSQNRKCALTKLDLKFCLHQKSSDATASLDRIDTTKGYIEGNVQWVHKDINYIKRDLAEEHFVYLCRLVANLN